MTGLSLFGGERCVLNARVNEQRTKDKGTEGGAIEWMVVCSLVIACLTDPMGAVACSRKASLAIASSIFSLLKSATATAQLYTLFSQIGILLEGNNQT